MKSRWPTEFLDTKAGRIYCQLIGKFPEEEYEAKNSDKLAKLIVSEIQSPYFERKFEKILQDGGGVVRDSGQQSKKVTGEIFELLVGEMLIMYKLTPVYLQAKLWGAPLMKADFLLYNERTPVMFTCKTSLAERWRQAEYEGASMKRIYQRGRCYLITNNKKQAARVQTRIDAVELSGIDQCLLADSKELKELLLYLSENFEFYLSSKVDPVESTRHIPTPSNQE